MFRLVLKRRLPVIFYKASCLQVYFYYDSLKPYYKMGHQKKWHNSVVIFISICTDKILMSFSVYIKSVTRNNNGGIILTDYHAITNKMHCFIDLYRES